MGIGDASTDADLAEVLLSADRIASRVAEIGAQVSADYRGQPLVVVGVLTGAAMFVADVIRSIEIPMELDFVAAVSYGADTRSSGEVRMLKDLSHAVSGKHVLLVEDIADTGLTLRYLMDLLRARNPASVAACVLLDKPTRRLTQVEIRYRGFEIEDRFVVGYGLDHAGRFRNLPYVGVLRG